MNESGGGMAKVLRAMCEGSAEAFDLFYARYAPFIMSIALRMLDDRMEAEDVCHDVFLEALRRGGDYDPLRGSVESWLAVMTRSRCLDRLRRRQRVRCGIGEEDAAAAERIAASSAPGNASPEEQALLRVQKEALWEALHALPPNQKQAIVGSYLGEVSQRELSVLWNVPLGTVKSWIRYGMNGMRRQLAKRGWQTSGNSRAKGGKSKG